jgi:DNA-binding NarL/FixJ family response regulator
VFSVLLIDDSEPYRRGLARLLSQMPDMTVIGEAENGLVGLALIKGLKPDVVVLDLQMPVLNGVAVLRAIREQQLRTKVVVMTTDPFIETDLRVLGADAVVMKGESADKLIPVLKRVATGGD